MVSLLAYQHLIVNLYSYCRLCVHISINCSAASVNFRMLRSSNTMLRMDMKCAKYRICKLPRNFPSIEWQVFTRSSEYCTNYSFLGMFEGLLYITHSKRCVHYYMPVYVCSFKLVSMYNTIWCKITSSVFPDPTRDLAN